MIILRQSIEKAVSPTTFPTIFLPLLLLSVDKSFANEYFNTEFRKSCSPNSFPSFFLPLLLLSVDESIADDYFNAESRKSC